MSHGFGCDPQMCRFVAPALEATNRVLLFDHAGCGHSDLSAYDEQRYRIAAGARAWQKPFTLQTVAARARSPEWLDEPGA